MRSSSLTALTIGTSGLRSSCPSIATRPETSRLSKAELTKVFARRGWLSEHPGWFRTGLLALVIRVVVRPGATVFRKGHKSDGLFGVVSGAVGVKGGYSRESPTPGHIMRTGQ